MGKRIKAPLRLDPKSPAAGSAGSVADAGTGAARRPSAAAQMTSNRTLWGRVLLVLAMAVAVVVGLGLPRAIRDELVGPWLRLGGEASMLLVVAGIAGMVWFGVGSLHPWRQRREYRKWRALEEGIVHTEKVESLGETIGGLAIAVEERQGGLAISERCGGLMLTDQKER